MVSTSQEVGMMYKGMMLAAAVFAALTSVATAQVVVASKTDTEGGLLGNIISQVLQSHDIAVTEQIQLGTTVVMRGALENGQIDIVQPVYEPAPLIREAVLQEYPEIAEWLAPVFAKLYLRTLQALNSRIQVGGEAAQSVAIDWLRSNGFIS